MSQFNESDYLRHTPDETGRMRDSLFFQTMFGPEQLGFQAYLYVTGEGKAGFNVILWGEGKPVGFDRTEGEVPKTMDFDNFTLGPLTIRNTGLGAPSQLTYSGEKMQIDFTFTGSHPPFSYHSNPDGLPRWFARNRFEQGGRLTGFIESKGNRYTMKDQAGHRDHSWGNRNWAAPQHWKWFCAYTPDGQTALNGWVWICRGEIGYAGFIHRDGRTVPIATIRDKAQYDADMSQRRLDAVLVDINGNETHLVLDRFGLIKLPAGDKYGTLIQEAACSATIDGAPGLGQFETQWQQSYVDQLRDTGAYK
ncbi:MAG: hypothetical protein KDE63_10440 [Novosphingobium sp.]|nr:hypothetical protein [Novosphingobium sp.]